MKIISSLFSELYFFVLLYILFLYDIFKIVMNMKEENLEKKIKKATLNKEYAKARVIVENEYIKMFKKMLKYKKVKIGKTLYFHDYLKMISKYYSSYYKDEVNELEEIMYSEKYSDKQQISWLIENCNIFDDYKL